MSRSNPVLARIACVVVTVMLVNQAGFANASTSAEAATSWESLLQQPEKIELLIDQSMPELERLDTEARAEEAPMPESKRHRRLAARWTGRIQRHLKKKLKRELGRVSESQSEQKVATLAAHLERVGTGSVSQAVTAAILQSALPARFSTTAAMP